MTMSAHDRSSFNSSRGTSTLSEARMSACGESPNAEHLAYAAEHGRTLITANRRDFLELHWEWLGRERSHSGIVIMKQRVSTGEQIRALSLMSETVNRGLMTSRLEYLSDWLAE